VPKIQRINPCLWFDGQAEQAARFYTGIFKGEIDYYWERLSASGDPKAQQCGWLKDKFGLSWQVVPTIMAELFKDENSAKSQRAMEAMLPMKKLDIAELKRVAGK
jgi:predicted 3-demethylubiquinone-9 3-methyltransferase (glyoxalase superfamily)